MSKANTRPNLKVEDDVDELDDVLTDFAKQPAPSTPGPSKAAASADPLVPPNTAAKPTSGILDADDFGNDFARELAEGMSKLMRDIAAESVRGEGEDGAPVSEDEKKREEEFKKAWEAMLIEGMNGALDMEDTVADRVAMHENKPREVVSADDPFQSSIRKAMEKLKVEENKEEAKLTDDDGETDPLEKLLSHIGDGGAESEEELQGLLESMMTQLMSKDVLYEPLKELHDKFPAYLKDNDAKLKEEDKTRYAAQQKIVTEIVEVFEDPSYSPENAEQGVKVVTLMNNMQGYGSPPPEIMGPLPPGLDLGPDGLPKLPEGCCIQ